MRFLLALSLLLAASGGTAAVTLSDAERQRAADAQTEAQAALQARGAAAEERRLAQVRVDGAARLRVTEARLSELTGQLDALEAQRAAAETRLKEVAAQLSPVLPLVQRLAQYPAETMLAVPLAPDDAVRGLLVLRRLTAGAAAEAAKVRTQEAELSRLAAAAAASLPAVRAAQQAQAAGAVQLDSQIASAQAAHATADGVAADAARRAAASASQAENVRTVLAQIDADRRSSQARAQADADRATRQKRDADAAAFRQKHDDLQRPAGPGVAEDQLVVPVAGALLRGWGERTDAGQASGISYRTPAGARVVSPCAGRVAFAGPFRSFGQLLIVDCGGGFHAVLAGSERLDVPVGRAVLAGEPVGVMGAGRPALYVELRRGGQPVNPAPFLKSRPNPSAL